MGWVAKDKGVETRHAVRRLERRCLGASVCYRQSAPTLGGQELLPGGNTHFWNFQSLKNGGVSKSGADSLSGCMGETYHILGSFLPFYDIRDAFLVNNNNKFNAPIIFQIFLLESPMKLFWRMLVVL